MDAEQRRSFGQTFVLRLIILLAITIVLYIALHFALPWSSDDCNASPECESSTSGQITWERFARIDELGAVTFYNLGDLDWYLGAENSVDSIRDLRDRSAEIIELLGQTIAQLRQAGRVVTPSGELDEIERLLNTGQYMDAFISLDELGNSLALATRNQVNFVGLKDRALMLSRLKRRQNEGLEDLSPPLAQLFFWTSPNLSILEVLFWSLFGILTNLLVNSAEYLRQRNFNPDERWVAYTKLVYGPILAMVIVLAIMFGWLSLGPYEARVWTLPLVGFIFGYASRRTVGLFEKLQTNVLGAAMRSAQEGPKKILEARSRTLALLREAARPKSIAEVKEKAKEFARQQVDLEAGLQEAQK